MPSERQRWSLTSSTLVVLPEEHAHEYAEVLRGFRDSFDPQDPAEDALVLRLAQAHWRSLRSRLVETGILNIGAAAQRAEARKVVEDCPEHLNPHNAIAVGFMVMPAERWQMYLRYDAAVSRDFFKTLDALTKLQRARRRSSRGADSKLAASTQAAAAPFTMAAGARSQVSDSGIRSVSQNRYTLPRPRANVLTRGGRSGRSARLSPIDFSPVDFAAGVSCFTRAGGGAGAGSGGGGYSARNACSNAGPMRSVRTAFIGCNRL